MSHVEQPCHLVMVLPATSAPQQSRPTMTHAGTNVLLYTWLEEILPDNTIRTVVMSCEHRIINTGMRWKWIPIRIFLDTYQAEQPIGGAFGKGIGHIPLGRIRN